MLRFYKSFSLILCALSACILISCRSVKQPASVVQPINYTDEDIVQNEIERINAFMENEPLRALWRAKLLGREEVIDSCFSKIEELYNTALSEKNYLDAKKYYKSLKAVKPQWKAEGYSLEQIEKLALAEVPGFSGVNKKAPAKISECIFDIFFSLVQSLFA